MMTLRCVAIPRLDPGNEGIHLAWTGPPMSELSTYGYDIQRRVWRGRQRPQECESIGRNELAILRARNELLGPLGPVLYRPAPAFALLDDPLLAPPPPQSLPDPGPGAAGSPSKWLTIGALESVADMDTRDSGELPAEAIKALRSETYGAATSVLVGSGGAAAECFTLELTQPTDLAVLTVQASAAQALAVSDGKITRTAVAPAPGTSVLRLEGQFLDTIILYVVRVIQFSLCVDRPLAADDESWADVPHLVRGLTLPIREADPSLNTDALELAAAQARLLSDEHLSTDDFNRITPTLRAAAGHRDLGRPGERILLIRSDPDQPFEQVSFASQLAILQIHSRWRRILGFGHADRDGLVPGETYEYRLTGYFNAADLEDTIYDVHAVPAGTMLPACVRIRDLALRFARPAPVVLHPAFPVSDLAVARRGIEISRPDTDPTWLVPSTDGWSLVIDFPVSTSSVVLELAEGHDLTYAPGLGWLGFGPSSPVPPSGRVRLDFGAPITQLRLLGTAVLFALRIPSGASGIVPQTVESGPVQFAPQPLPEPPTVLSVYNLQPPPAVITGDIGEQTPVPARPEPGFNLVWLPATLDGVGSWPTDLEAHPPLDAVAYQIEHRQVLPPMTGDCLRNYVFGLRPGILADRQLDRALRELAADFAQRAGLTPTVEIDVLLAARLGGARATDVVQIAREALSNVARHAQGSTCRLVLRREAETAVLEVADDGNGIALHGDPSTGHGLGNMRARAAALGGLLSVSDGLASRGTAIRVVFPQ